VVDQITSDLIRSSLLYASEEMGIALRNSSYSPNIKERMDHSAAIFDSEGRLLAQAEHIPVHLGSLPWGLKNILERCEVENIALEEGSMVVTNNPYIAGTHLNDITVVRPIFHAGRIVAFAANKAHHSDVGGRVPGSISVDARSLHEEGLVINPTYLMRRGEFERQVLSFITSNSRTAEERSGDLKAQVAANHVGERRVLEIIQKYGVENFVESSDLAFAYAERMIRSRLARMRAGEYSAEDFLEDPDGLDIKLKLKITLREGGETLEFDYTGTAAEVENPMNSVFGVTLSGVHYVTRALLGDDVPANHGTFSVMRVRAPQGIILNPTYPHAVAIGNLETSQRNADLIFRVLSKVLPDKVPAASGGSMNNIMMGGFHSGRPWAFYETMGVGLGARPKMDGLDGIQCNMTNTMNTPIEDIERTLPVIVRRYEFRPDSSGAGRFRGGCGLVRMFEMTGESSVVTVVSDRSSRHPPWGLKGGADGVPVEVVLHEARKRTVIPAKSSVGLRRGDSIEIRTSGGGGFGSPKSREREKIEEDLANGLLSSSYVRRNYPSYYRRKKRKQK